MALAAIFVLKFLSNGDGAPPCGAERKGSVKRAITVLKTIQARVCASNLLHVTEDVLPAVEHSSSLLVVQLVYEVSGEVHVTVLVSVTHSVTREKLFRHQQQTKIHTHLSYFHRPPGCWEQNVHSKSGWSVIHLHDSLHVVLIRNKDMFQVNTQSSVGDSPEH